METRQQARVIEQADKGSSLIQNFKLVKSFPLGRVEHIQLIQMTEVKTCFKCDRLITQLVEHRFHLIVLDQIPEGQPVGRLRCQRSVQGNEIIHVKGGTQRKVGFRIIALRTRCHVKPQLPQFAYKSRIIIIKRIQKDVRTSISIQNNVINVAQLLRSRLPNLIERTLSLSLGSLFAFLSAGRSDLIENELTNGHNHQKHRDEIQGRREGRIFSGSSNRPPYSQCSQSQPYRNQKPMPPDEESANLEPFEIVIQMPIGQEEDNNDSGCNTCHLP